MEVVKLENAAKERNVLEGEMMIKTEKGEDLSPPNIMKIEITNIQSQEAQIKVESDSDSDVLLSKCKCNCIMSLSKQIDDMQYLFIRAFKF